MEAIKYFTPEYFDRKAFADMLVYKCNVKAIPVSGGVIFDREAFNAIPAANLPHWAYINKKYINNEFHARSATEEEAAMLIAPVTYAIVVTVDNGKGGVIALDNGRSDSFEAIQKAAVRAADALRSIPDFLSVTILGVEPGQTLQDAEIIGSVN